MFSKVFSFLNLNFANPAAVKKDGGNSGVLPPLRFKYMTKEQKNKKLRETFSNIPRFETRRLVLRRIDSGDCEDMFEYSSDSDVTRFLTWVPHKNTDETREYIDDVGKKYATGQFFDWGLVYKFDGKFIGTCGLTSVNLNRNTCEVGYVLSKRYWGRGLMTEALEQVMDFAFDYFGFDKIEARFLDGNISSKKVMLKTGMTFEKTERNSMHIKGEYKTVHTYSIARGVFEKRRESLGRMALINRANSW
ncbi:MAG: GNAT family N-acetyltransferase [Oscillospiraceae bacterium]|nr:GNAT family N-acetyltransferase [Oscillospiraceae bacterium]